MSVLYLTYDGLTDPIGQSQIVPYLCGLGNKGFSICVLSFEKERYYSFLGVETMSLLNKKKISWKPLPYHKNPPVISSVFDFFSGIIHTCLLIREYRVKLIHCRGHYVVVLMGYLFRIILRIPYLYDIRGFWADERVDGKLWNLRNPLHFILFHLLKKLEQRFLKSAYSLVTLTTKAKKYLEREKKIIHKIEVIPCCVDRSVFFKHGPATRDEYRKKIGIHDEFLLVYLGSLGTWYMPEEMLDFFRTIRNVENGIKFLFLINGGHTALETLASRKGVSSNDIRMLSVPRKEVPKYLSCADASVFFIRPVFSKIASSPTKHAELLACGLPVLCNDGIGDLPEIITESNTGVVLRSFDEKAYKDAYQKMKAFTLSGDANFNAVLEKYYSLDGGINSYGKIYSRVLAARIINRLQ